MNGGARSAMAPLLRVVQHPEWAFHACLTYASIRRPLKALSDGPFTPPEPRIMFTLLLTV